jgi:hypothetical protein
VARGAACGLGRANEGQISGVIRYLVEWERSRRIGFIKPPSGRPVLGIHFLSRHIGLQHTGHEPQENPRYFSKRTVDQAPIDTQQQCEQVSSTLQL